MIPSRPVIFLIACSIRICDPQMEMVIVCSGGIIYYLDVFKGYETGQDLLDNEFYFILNKSYHQDQISTLK